MRVLEVIRSLNVGGSQKLLLNRLSTRAARLHETLVFNTLPSESAMLDVFTAAGIRVEASESNFTLLSSIRLIRLIRDSDFDLVISHSVVTTIIISLAKAMRLIEIPVVEVAHQTRHQNKLLEWVKVLTNRWTDLVMPVSVAVNESRIVRGSKRVKVINHGVPIQQMKTWLSQNRVILETRRERMAMGLENPLRVIYCARLVAFKRVDVLIEAIAKTPKATVTLTVAGSGPIENAAIHLVEELGIQDRVDFMGEISEGWRAVASADVLVLPSDSEGLSVSLMEALAIGVPCIVTDIPGMREILTEARDSLFIKRGDSNELAQKLEMLATDSKLLRELSLGAEKQGLLWDIEVSANTLYATTSSLLTSVSKLTTYTEQN